MSAVELAEWEARYRAADLETAAPEPFVVEAAAALPVGGKAIDLAGGTGRHALWLAGRGWDTTLVDISPTALAVAAAAALRLGLGVATEVVDLDAADPSGGPWDLVVIHHYLNRPLLGRLHHMMRPGGAVVVCHQTRLNLERHPRPGARHLLAPGELEELLSRFELAAYLEGWTPQGRHEARAIGRRTEESGAVL